jgi:glyoxylase-like metal-dependent hydrolase (beta-lactamase superfamily II)
MLVRLLVSLMLTATNLIVYISPSGDCSTIWPANATPEQIADRSLPRVEIFKMPGGTEYIIHDINESNHIIGKARFSGHLKVSESMSVDGFGGHDILDDVGPGAEESNAPPGNEGSDSSYHFTNLIKPPSEPPPTFHPPSFGVTVLGNSHGFDKSGSTSGYVLWINGRGVMIDPPPYSSATLEREGIRPRMIVGIILTHCHADHDAGAFQKVLTGSPVVVITTPTIYKSFIRKYAALSALSPALLRHSHRFKPAIIGQPLRFQGATFYVTYTLHTIPCIGFRVEWRGRSMVFTGDHFNSPPALDKLQETGVLSKARADDLRNLPLQDTDLLLHEAGAPPIHTPLEVLLQLPERVKKHLYVVHTSALPEGCELRVAPTGTAGTIRLDQSKSDVSAAVKTRQYRDNSSSLSLRDDEFVWNGHNEYDTISEDSLNSSSHIVPRDSGFMTSSFAHTAATGTPPSTRKARANSVFQGEARTPPLVSLRPASSTDAWFILNLLSAVPFLSR